MEVFMDKFFIYGSSVDHCLKNLEKMLKSVLTESYEGASPKMRHHKSFDNVIVADQEGIMVLSLQREKSLKVGSTIQISSAMHVAKVEMVGPFSISKDMKNGAMELYEEEGNEFIVNKQRVKPYQKDVLEDDKNDDITQDDEGEVTLYLIRKSLEVLRKIHWMITGGQFNQLSHVSSPLLSKPGEYKFLLLVFVSLYSFYGYFYRTLRTMFKLSVVENMP
nr:hypothetical protein [Tanacetum cinerariifolium]